MALMAVAFLGAMAQAETPAPTPPEGPFKAGEPTHAPTRSWARSLPMPYWLQSGVRPRPPAQGRQNAPQAGTLRQPDQQAPQRQAQPYRQNRTWTPFGTFTRTQPGGYYTPYTIGAPNQYYGYVPPSFPVPPFFPNGPWGGYRGPVGPGYGSQYGYGTPPRLQN
jgi:hypothetical protein